MTHTLLAGLSLIDTLGLAILTTTLGTLLLGIIINLALRARYASLEKDLRLVREPDETFSHPVLDHIVRDAMEASRRSGEANNQAIIEEHFQTELRGTLLAERYVRAATGLVIILGLLGTFYGLTLSIGKIVNLVAAESGVGADITQGVTQGLTQALSGMASSPCSGCCPISPTRGPASWCRSRPPLIASCPNGRAPAVTAQEQETRLRAWMARWRDSSPRCRRLPARRGTSINSMRISKTTSNV
jgi:hypothetical protein